MHRDRTSVRKVRGKKEKSSKELLCLLLLAAGPSKPSCPVLGAQRVEQIVFGILCLCLVFRQKKVSASPLHSDTASRATYRQRREAQPGRLLPSACDSEDLVQLWHRPVAEALGTQQLQEGGRAGLRRRPGERRGGRRDSSIARDAGVGSEKVHLVRARARASSPPAPERTASGRGGSRGVGTPPAALRAGGQQQLARGPRQGRCRAKTPRERHGRQRLCKAGRAHGASSKLTAGSWSAG